MLLDGPTMRQWQKSTTDFGAEMEWVRVVSIHPRSSRSASQQARRVSFLLERDVFVERSIVHPEYISELREQGLMQIVRDIPNAEGELLDEPLRPNVQQEPHSRSIDGVDAQVKSVKPFGPFQFQQALQQLDRDRTS